MNTPIPFKLKITFVSGSEKFTYTNLSDLTSEITLPEPDTAIGVGSLFNRKNKTYEVNDIEILPKKPDKNDDTNFEIVYQISVLNL